MDKYEYNLKLDQMKTLMAEKKYQEAAKIADTINWRRIKNVTALVRAAEVYESVGQYDLSKDILLTAYDRSPIGRSIIYRLACLAIKTKSFDEAKEYYREFIEIAPYDNLRYVLKYEINKAQGADYATLIANLEEIKEHEFSEEWGYKLAYTCHQAGLAEQCIEVCDELVLYFGDGVYVERALELKMLYQPLSRQQEEIYRRLRRKGEEVVEVTPGEALDSGEIVSEPVQIPPIKVSPERFNTQNLQEALQKSLQQITEATEEKTVEDGMDAIKKLVEEIPYLQLPKEDEKEEEKEHIATDKEIEESLKTNFQELLNEEYDGQLRILVPEGGVIEPQVRGQMTIEDVLAEWEKTKRAAETALEEAKQQKFESAKARALQEAGDIMERLVDVIPKLDSGLTPQDLLKEQYLAGDDQPEERAAEMVANMNQILQKEIERLHTENAQMDERLAEAKEQPERSEAPEAPEMPSGITELVAEAAYEEEVPVEENPIEENPIEVAPAEEASIEEIQIEEAPVEEVPVAEEIEPEELVLEQTLIEEALLEKALVEEVATEEKDYFVGLGQDQEELFSYFIPIKGMEVQISKALNATANRLKMQQKANTANLIITGGSGSGKTVLATNYLKALQREIGQPTGKIGKIDATTLNEKEIETLYEKILGGCLIIEGAAELKQETMLKLVFLMEHDTKGTLFIMEDSKHRMDTMLAKNKTWSQVFSERIDIPIFTSDELVVFAKAYAKELGYVIDEMGILALYNCISNIQKLDQATSIAEVKVIIDDAIAHVHRGKIRKAFSVLTASRYNENDYIILREKDFDN